MASDASLEAKTARETAEHLAAHGIESLQLERAKLLRRIYHGGEPPLFMPEDGQPWLTMVRAADASRPVPAAPERTFPRVTLSAVAPGSLVEIASGDIGIALAAPGLCGQRPMVWIVTGNVGSMPEGATVSLRATPAELDAMTSADTGQLASGETIRERDVAQAELSRVLAHVATLPARCAPVPPPGTRPAVRGGECARCLAPAGYHEDTCSRRATPGLTEDFIRGATAAADVASSYNADSAHPYRLDDCILAKLNIRKEPPRPNDRRCFTLTEGQAREMAREAILGANGGRTIVDRVAAALLRAARGETGPTCEQPKE